MKWTLDAGLNNSMARRLKRYFVILSRKLSYLPLWGWGWGVGKEKERNVRKARFKFLFIVFLKRTCLNLLRGTCGTLPARREWSLKGGKQARSTMILLRRVCVSSVGAVFNRKIKYDACNIITVE